MFDANHAVALLAMLERHAREHPSLTVTAAIAATQRSLHLHRGGAADPAPSVDEQPDNRRPRPSAADEPQP